jgi:tetratricopeptide (TPR) repeat protein
MFCIWRAAHPCHASVWRGRLRGDHHTLPEPKRMAAPQTGTPVRKPRRRWRWHVPPALVHGDESLEGSQLLEEFSGAAGLALWQSMRDATLWAGAREPEERGGLFRPGAYEQRIRQIEAAGLDAALDAPLRTLAGISRDPEAVREEEILGACSDIARWAEGQEKLGTAIALAQAGALAAPTNAAAGFRVGQLTRNNGEYARAESWFRRVIGLGRQAKDWASYSEAFLGLGNLYLQRGNVPAARRFFVRGLRAARRHGLRDIVARALHDLFVIAVDAAPPAEALEYARAAFKAYGPTHRKLPALGHDLAYFWMQRGRFAQALSVFQGLIPHLEKPCEQMQNLADIARAAGGAGNRAVYDEAWSEMWSFAGDWYTRPTASQALLDLARGAASLKDWSRAERAATTSRDVAQRREEARVAMEAEALLDSVSRKRNLETAKPVAAGAEEEAESEGLAADLIRTLAAGTGRK